MMYVNSSEYIRQLNCSVTGYGCGYDPYVDQGTVKRSNRKRHQLSRTVAAYGQRQPMETTTAERLLQKALKLYPPKHGNNSGLVQYFKSDSMICSTRREVVAAAKVKGTAAYMYRFDWFFQSDKRCTGDSNWHPPSYGSIHCDEMTFVFGQPIFDNQDAPGYSYTNCSDPHSKYYDKEHCVGCKFDPREAAFARAIGRYWT